MNEQAILKILNYIKNMEKPNGCCSRELLAKRSYSRWCAYEILNLVRDNPTMAAVGLVEEFVRKLDGWSCVNSKTSLMFSVAHDTAVDILDHLL